MKVLFFFPSTGYYTRGISNPLGLLSIATYLKQNGYEVKINDRCIKKENVKKLLSDFKPDIVGVSVMSSRGLEDAIKVSQKVKSCGYKIVWGGQLPSIQPELVLENDYVDYISIGEGEETWLELLDTLEKNKPVSDVKGLAYRENGAIVYTEERPFSELSKMPVSDYSLIDVPKYMKSYLGCKKMMYFYSSKGCPCRCSFCTNKIFHRCTYRKRPNEYVIEEIKYLNKEYGVDGAYFSDELWCLKRSDALDFCNRIKEADIHINWGMMMRLGILKEDDYQLMYDAGCRWILFGVESGSKEMLNKIHKEINYDEIIPTFELMRKIGIMTIATFIIGYPDETEEQVQDTVNLINAVNANFTTVYHFTPLPGTELYDELFAKGLYKASESLKTSAKIVATESLGTNYSKIPDRDLKVIRTWYMWKAFSGKKIIPSDKPFEFARETIVEGLQSIAKNGPLYFIVNGFCAFKEFIYTLWYSHAYPGIKKKYGLKK